MATFEEMKYMVIGKFWETHWRLKNRIKRIGCWFVDHDIVWPDEIERFYGQADYCPKCYMDGPEEANTLPTYLNRIYVWFVLRDWEWFERLDDWLMNNYNKRLPSWWEY